jgi:hypothetical protein
MIQNFGALNPPNNPRGIATTIEHKTIINNDKIFSPIVFCDTLEDSS